jgi:transcriptional regulator with PAS, ATPase and Fis domain
MLPPLRQRTDLEALVAALLSQLGGSPPPAIDAEVIELFRRHRWPGNLRQLSNLLRTAAVMAEGEGAIGRNHLPDDFIEDVALLHGDMPRVGTGTVPPEPTFPIPTTEARATPSPADNVAGRLEDMALVAIREAIARHQGNLSAAARTLGISRNTLYRKLQQP